MICFGEGFCRDLAAALEREWLETDGLGGFASSTILGCNTRRYHGLLVAATQPPVGRRVLLSKVEERLRSGAEHIALSTNLYPGAVHPQGYRYVGEFRLDPWPVTIFAGQAWRLQKEVFQPYRRGLTVVRYTLMQADQPLWLHLRPLFACRDYHHLATSGAGFRTDLQRGRDRFTLQPWDANSRVTLIHSAGEFWPDGVWYYQFLYPREQERGLDCCEDLYSPGEIACLLAPGEEISLVATTDPDTEITPNEWAEEERARRQALVSSVSERDLVGRRLVLAMDQFVVQRRVKREPLLTLIAGYPWFADWGRDAMIALGGLLAVPGWEERAKQVLHAFAAHLREGLLPNTFADSGEGAAYNTVDASLWFVHAVRRYAQTTRDLAGVAEHLYEPVRQILAAYRQGTDFGIGMDADGLLRAGSPQTQLTWMDAKSGDEVFTPRHGKPVEVNALWYSALRTGQYLAERLAAGEGASELGLLAAQARRSFRAQFWNPQRGYCYDCLHEEGPDASLRPNQIIALALPYALLSREQARSVFRAVTEHLLTPYGLRTLAPFEPGYRGRYEGDQYERDSAYHQGTVWPWLLGPYVTALFSLQGVSDSTRRQARSLLQPLVDHLCEAGLGSISEVFDGDPPHRPGGCPAQAWSVAEVLRCWLHYRLGEV